MRKFKGVAATIFGNGWLWVTWKDGRVRMVATREGDTPIVRGHTVLLALDLCEHAYYLDHQNRRAAYIRAFLHELVDWEFANSVLRERVATPGVPLLPGRAPAVKPGRGVHIRTH